MVMVSNQSGTRVGIRVGRHPGRIGHLYSPGGARGPWREIPFALDNGAYSAWENRRTWDEAAWLSLLRWAGDKRKLLRGEWPLWAVVPDVVANREETLRRWEVYSPVVRSFGFRPAFAVQDGMTFEDVPSADCMLFLGGTTDDDLGPGKGWKEKAIETWCARFPGRVHVARVNAWKRLAQCWRAGAVSVDGTGWFREGKSNGSTSWPQTAQLDKFLRETERGVA